MTGEGEIVPVFQSIRRQPAAHNVIGDMFAHVSCCITLQRCDDDAFRDVLLLLLLLHRLYDIPPLSSPRSPNISPCLD